MGKTPPIKVYDASGKYRASVDEPEAAAALLTLYCGGTIRYGHRLILYTDVVDGDPGNSYDDVAEICFKRMPPGRAGPV